MSLSGLIATRGSLATIRRASRSGDVDASSALTWADQATRVRVLLEPITADAAQRVWGIESEGTVRGLLDSTTGLHAGDGLVIVTGAYAGDCYRVHGVLRQLLGGSPHLEAALLVAPAGSFD